MIGESALHALLLRRAMIMALLGFDVVAEACGATELDQWLASIQRAAQRLVSDGGEDG